MAGYSKTNWVDRSVQFPSKFTMVDNGDGTVTLTPAPGTITNPGTPITADVLNNLETQYDQAVQWAKGNSFGLNSTRQTVDLNTMKTEGVYSLDTGITNGPSSENSASSANFGVLQVQVSSDVIIQTVYSFYDNTMWLRVGSGPSTFTWGTWKRLSTFSDFGKSFGNSGYQKLPNGLILQWGETSAASGTTIPLPVTPPNTVMKVFANPYSGSLYYAQTTAKTNTGFNIVHNAPTGTIIFWFAITY